jgi:primosomal protein N' (replication factor Y)
LTVHASAGQLRCHHCGRTESLRWACPSCNGERIAVGAGTQRVTSELESLFPEHAVVRLDRDAVSGREALGQVLAEIEAKRASIIVGTQLLTKGHDFPAVTLVGVLNADQGLFGADFRSEERLAQTIIQVAGRAGRRDEQGEVLIQTHYPGHPLLQLLLNRDYGAFAEHSLAELSHLAVFRAEAAARDRVFSLLGRLKEALEPTPAPLRVLGPTPDWMERREGRYRAQLLLQSRSRAALHAGIDRCLEQLAKSREARRVRWSVDVDPTEL